MKAEKCNLPGFNFSQFWILLIDLHRSPDQTPPLPPGPVHRRTCAQEPRTCTDRQLQKLPVHWLSQSGTDCFTASGLPLPVHIAIMMTQTTVKLWYFKEKQCCHYGASGKLQGPKLEQSDPSRTWMLLQLHSLPTSELCWLKRLCYLRLSERGRYSRSGQLSEHSQSSNVSQSKMNGPSDHRSCFFFLASKNVLSKTL
jgi:hypothetical protein